MPKITFPVEATHIMMFARAIGDTNPVYHDAEAAKKTEAKGVIAPPTFVQAMAQFDPEYHLRPKPGQKWFGSGKNPTGLDNKPPSSGGNQTGVCSSSKFPNACGRRTVKRLPFPMPSL